jgi:hypothetical protein
MYIEDNDNFDKTLINSWKNEIKPYILQKFPLSKDGLFTVNSDLEYLIKIIESLKEKYEIKQKETEIKNINDNLIDNAKNEEEGNTYKINEIESVDIQHKSPKLSNKPKRRGTDAKFPEIENIKKSENIDNQNNDFVIINNEDIKQLRKENKSRINEFLVEFIKENIVPLRKSNSMKELRPHSHTVDSKTTCESSINECNNNLNIKKLLSDLKEKKNNKEKKLPPSKKK